MPRTVVITGSAGGIGRATADRLSGKGMRVIGVDLRDADVQVDLATPEGRQALVDEVATLTPAIDALIVCAGVDVPDPLTIRVNYFGAIATLVGLREILAAGTLPRAVVIASHAAIQPTATEDLIAACLQGDENRAVALSQRAFADGLTRATYASAKQALCRWVRAEAPGERWAAAGIPLNAVAPGIIATPMTRTHLEDPVKLAAVQARVPMPLHGPGEPEHVASLLDWLAGPENVLVTGQIIFIDGGSDALLRGADTW